MRNPILAVAIAIVLAAPSSAGLADTKKPKPKPVDDLPKESIEFNYGSVMYSQHGNGSNLRKPITTTVNPALQGNVLQKSGGVGSPVKPGYDLKANKGAR
jgi:hypothetical protein